MIGIHCEVEKPLWWYCDSVQSTIEGNKDRIKSLKEISKYMATDRQKSIISSQVDSLERENIILQGGM